MQHFQQVGNLIKVLYGDKSNPVTWYKAVIDRVITSTEDDRPLRYPKLVVTSTEYGNTETIGLGEIDVLDSSGNILHMFDNVFTLRPNIDRIINRSRTTMVNMNDDDDDDAFDVDDPISSCRSMALDDVAIVPLIVFCVSSQTIVMSPNSSSEGGEVFISPLSKKYVCLPKDSNIW
jgi:hypothetical protein